MALVVIIIIIIGHELCRLKFTSVFINIVYSQNYWVFGICPSPGIIETRKHNVSEMCFLPQVRWQTATQSGPLETANLNHWLDLSTGPNRVCICLFT
jgi:hypothetical protein